MKEKLLKDIEIKLSMKFSADDREKIMQCVISSLRNYEVSEMQTDLCVRYDDINERLLKRYVACLRIDGKSEKTIRQYVYTLSKFAEAAEKPFTEIKPDEIRYYLGTVKQRGCTNRYIENERSYISAFYNWMLNEEIIEKNPCVKIKPIKLEDQIKLPFTPVEIDKLRNTCNRERDRAIIELFLSSGIRCEELCNLKLTDIDIAKKTVHVRNGKGGKDRVTFMSDVAAEHISKYLSNRNLESDYIFGNRKTGGPVTTDSIRKRAVKMGATAGIENVHPHRFRRTFATDLYRRGMDIYSIGKLMGHSNIATTKGYISTADDQLQADYTRFSA